MESSDVTLAVDNISSQEIALTEENLALKLKIKALESDKGYLNIDIESWSSRQWNKYPWW